jgi:hypothetical protein
MTKSKKPVTRETFRHEVDPNDPEERAFRKAILSKYYGVPLSARPPRAKRPVQNNKK